MFSGARDQGTNIRSSTTSKVLLELSTGITIFSENIRKLESTSIQHLVIVCRDEHRTQLQNELAKLDIKKNILFSTGGTSRAESVKNGLKTLFANSEPKVIAVHDGARPFFSVELLEKAIIKAQNGESLVFASKITSTIKESDSELSILRTVPRSNLWEVQTPQVFPTKILFEAYENSNLNNVNDDSELVERLGIKVTLLESPRDNIKITLPEDLAVAKYLYSMIDFR